MKILKDFLILNVELQALKTHILKLVIKKQPNFFVYFLDKNNVTILAKIFCCCLC